MKLTEKLKSLLEDYGDLNLDLDLENIADYLTNSMEHDEDDDAVKHIVSEFGVDKGDAVKLVKGYPSKFSRGVHKTKEIISWIASIVK